MQMMLEDTEDSDTELRGTSTQEHLEYNSIDEMLLGWLEELKRNPDNFQEEVEYIENIVR